MIREVLRFIIKSNLVIEVIDAREPDLTRSKMIEKFALNRNKKVLIVLNKADLVPRDILEGWKKIFEREGFPTVYISATMHLGTKILRDKIKEVLRGNEGTVIFVGYPKTGKSSIINALKGSHSASTSKIPMAHGYTKAIQKFKIDSKIYAWDSPGIIPPDGNELEKVIRGVNVDKLEDSVKAAIMLFERIRKYNPNAISETYGIEFNTPYEFFEKLALRRGWIYKSTKEPNIDEAAKAFIRDYHKGKIIYYVPPLSMIDDKNSSL
ncbi:50S ribosome-binding GTPase [Sulfurisphaera javensis]|uniref:50S ribosome-binding GTPase n=1 Tax=Sulfurisphaera javensis TaxID=2049879 RepID=A0AAT9GUB3_9CREN